MKRTVYLSFPYVLILVGLVGIFFKSYLINISWNRGYYGILVSKQSIGFPVFTASGDKIDLSDINKPLKFVYFGYTQCKSICPTSMGILYRLSKKLKGKLGYVFVSLDPERDTFQNLNKYTKGFGDDFYFSKLEKNTLTRLSRSYGVSHVEINEAGITEINHSNFLFLLDKTNTIRLLYLGRHNDLNQIIGDVKRLSLEIASKNH